MITQVLLATLVITLSLALAAGLGAPLTAWVLRAAQRAPDAHGTAAPELHAAVNDPAGDEHDSAAAAAAAAASSSALASPPPPPPVDRPAADGPDGTTARGVLRGGLWIGILERLAVTATILAGFPAGIAVVVAIKGLGRYPELRENPAASERFVIGSLASLLWACGVGLAGAAWLAVVTAA